MNEGVLLRQAITQSGLTLSEVARHTHTTAGTMSKYCRGMRIPDDIIFNLEDLLGSTQPYRTLRKVRAKNYYMIARRYLDGTHAGTMGMGRR